MSEKFEAPVKEEIGARQYGVGRHDDKRATTHEIYAEHGTRCGYGWGYGNTESRGNKTTKKRKGKEQASKRKKSLWYR